MTRPMRRGSRRIECVEICVVADLAGMMLGLRWGEATAWICSGRLRLLAFHLAENIVDDLYECTNCNDKNQLAEHGEKAFHDKSPWRNVVRGIISVTGLIPRMGANIESRYTSLCTYKK